MAYWEEWQKLMSSLKNHRSQGKAPHVAFSCTSLAPAKPSQTQPDPVGYGRVNQVVAPTTTAEPEVVFC